MTEFKQDDAVRTRIDRESSDGSITIGRGSLGHVTVVGVELEDGSMNGIEVLFEGGSGQGKYACYNSTQLTKIDELPEEDRPYMKKDRDFDPMSEALAYVNAGFYDGKLDIPDVYIVWFCSTLQNWKALVSTNVKDNAYYEVTHNGDKKETYVDQYFKHAQLVVNTETGKATRSLINKYDI